MNTTTMKMKVVVGSPTEEGQIRPTPESGSTDPHAFLQMRARQRVRRARFRRFKRAVIALGTVGLMVGLWSHRHGRRPTPLAVALPPAALAPALPAFEVPAPAAPAATATPVPPGASC